MGREPLLVWYTQHDRILSPAELERILRRNRDEPEALVAESVTFWRNHDRATPRDIRRYKTIIQSPTVQAHCDMFRRWRRSR